MNLISLFTASILTQNIVLTKFLGICPFVGTSNKEKSALAMGTCVTSVLVMSSLICYLLYHYVLVPTDTTYLRTIMFILVIASLVQITDIIVKKYSPKLHKILGIYLPLIATNCAILGTVLLSTNNEYTLAETFVFALGSGFGFTLVLYIFASIRERLNRAKVPNAFKGLPIAFVTAAIMTLLFMRYGS